jgi:hypothetical protein|uniref:Transcription factor TFIIB cyclin-like domain-containing protein n=1 Tax=viral metagenome TaxID=1070528 RepID=A0A6C0IY33_9ZZZZ
MDEKSSSTFSKKYEPRPAALLKRILGAKAPPLPSKTKSSIPLCCGKPMDYSTPIEFVCSKCSAIEVMTYEIVEDDKKPKQRRPIALGKNAYKFTKQLNASCCEDYSITRLTNLSAKFRYYWHESKSALIPDSIEPEVIDIVQKSLKEQTNRSDILKQIFAAAIKYVCINRKVTIRDKDISEFMQLSKSGFTEGDRIIRGLSIRSIIDLDVSASPTEGHVNRIFKTLGIDDRLRVIVYECLEALHVYPKIRQSKSLTKCVTIIWLLIRSLGVDISVATVDKECKVKKHTFIPLATEIIKRTKKSKSNPIKIIFEKHDLIFPIDAEQPKLKGKRGPKGKRSMI